VEAAKRRGPPKGYIETLEHRCARLEKVLQQVSGHLVGYAEPQLHPGVDFTSTVGPAPDREEFDIQSYQEALRGLGIPPFPAIKPLSTLSSSFDSPSAASAPSPAIQVLGPQPWKTYEQDPHRPPSEPEHDLEHAAMHHAMAQAMTKLDVKDTHWRFHGKASPHHLVMIFNEMRYAKSGRNILEGIRQSKRNEYWQVPEWEIVIANEGLHNVDFSLWPDPKLARALIEAYFTHINFHFPLLNHVIFDKQYDMGLYKTNHDFAKVCLMVFANGSRFVDDDRVYWPVDDAMTEEGKERLRTDKDGTLRYSAGWKYLRALLKMGRSVMQGPNLFDFQCQVLTCLFLHGSAVPHLTWLVSGIGLRAAQEIGIHVRSILLHADPIERALYNRAFWCLYHIDRLNCASIGRSVALQDTDFDADYPIAVDDEYWDTGDADRNFVQPPSAGVPKVAAFIHTLKLDHIIGAALRTIYAINKAPGQKSDIATQRAVVVELDSALNSWADAVPDGLRWDPTRSDQQLFEQSAALYVYYYYCQILVHRPFIPTAKHTESIGLPSLAICSNASRSICNIIDVVMRRGRQSGALPGKILPVQFMLPAWIAAIILLISVYSGKQQPSERERAIADIKKCIVAMKEMELTWRQAGKLTDVMIEFARELDGPEDFASPQQGCKRPHEPTAPTAVSEDQPHASPDTWQPPRNQPFPSPAGGPTEPAGNVYQGGTETLFDASIFEEFYGQYPTESLVMPPMHDGRFVVSTLRGIYVSQRLGPDSKLRFRQSTAEETSQTY
jgi:hypothetical protein